MDKCKHEYLIYTGRQETSVFNKFVYLCTCIECNSTIVLPKELITDFSGTPFLNLS